jgi:hypothetical protein
MVHYYNIFRRSNIDHLDEKVALFHRNNEGVAGMYPMIILMIIVII